MLDPRATLRHSGGSDKHEAIELYELFEFQANYFVTEKWGARLILPLARNRRYIDDSLSTDCIGVSDPTILLNHQLINTSTRNDTALFTHQLNIVSGIKFPIGKTKIEHAGSMLDMNMQPGTGSLDFLFGMNYYIRLGKAGANLNFNYKLNTFSIETYRYGNTTNFTVNTFLSLPAGVATFIPEIGYYLEFAETDQTSGLEVLESGGCVTYVTGGISMNVYHALIGIRYMGALTSNQLGRQLPTVYRFAIALKYNFS